MAIFWFGQFFSSDRLVSDTRFRHQIWTPVAAEVDTEGDAVMKFRDRLHHFTHFNR